MLLDVGYLGNKGTHMFTRTEANAINPATSTRPLAGFGLTDYKRMDGNRDFDGLSVTLKRKFSSGWLLGANYLWSHSIHDAGTGGGEADYPENIACLECERASSDQDVGHSFTSSAIYQLPFGPGRKYLNGNGIAAKVFGGWELSGIGAARTGVPVNVTISRSASSLPDGNTTSPQRPNLVPGVSLIPPGGQTTSEWINPAAFSIPANGTWGNAGRNLRPRRLPNGNFSASGSFGTITQPLNTGATGTGTPRQFQLMLRLSS